MDPVLRLVHWKAGCVPVNRKAGSQALVQMTARAKEEAQHGRQILIFPEGTRRPPGAPPAYKFGVAHLYQNLGFPCIPVALNSGPLLAAPPVHPPPRHDRIEILDPIPPGLPRDEFFQRMQERIETASDRLLAEGRRELGLDLRPARQRQTSSKAVTHNGSDRTP